MENLYYIILKYTCFGLITKDNIIIETAPIARLWKNQNINDFLTYYKYKRKLISYEIIE